MLGLNGQRSNNSFKPNLLRSSESVAEKACHAFASTTQVGLIQVLVAGGSLSHFVRMYLLASSGLMAIGALLHLAAIFMGANAYAWLGAPAGLVAMVGTASHRPAISCVVIAGLLLLSSAYGLSGAGLGPPLPARRLVLSLIAVGLIARGILLPITAVWQPYFLSGICGRCQTVNGFVLLTSALCLIVGAGYAVGAFRPASNNSFKPNLLRSTKRVA